MENLFGTIIDKFGIFGVLGVILCALVYLIYNDRKNNWGAKIDILGGKIDCLNTKIDMVETKVTDRVESCENKIAGLHKVNKEKDQIDAKKQTHNAMTKCYGGRLSRILKNACQYINCNHVFLGEFHNGTTDLRGIHYCKFDIVIDEFENPLHLCENDVDFQPLYKDENIIAYGDLPYKLSHIDSAVLSVDDELLELSDTLYRRCKSRDIKYIGFAGVRDKDGFLIGFVGCVSFDADKIMNKDRLKDCATEIENIYNNQYE